MGLTSAMFTGLTGLNSNQFSIDTISDNVANMNTTGYKSHRAMFQTQFARTLTTGSPPTANEGGTNPLQIGMGSGVGAVQRLHTPGSLETTGVPTDLAIEGTGFFILAESDNKQAFTRDGAFGLNGDNFLVSHDGFFVQGYGVDEDFNVVPGILTNLQIPLGSTSIAEQTSNATLEGNIDSSGSVGTQGSAISTQIFQGAGGAAAIGTTLLTSLRDPAVGAPAFAVGDTITVTGDAEKGGRDLAEASFTVGAGDTVTSFMAWLNGVFGINQDANAPATLLDSSNAASSKAPGWYVSTGGVGEPAAGSIYVVGNHGTGNALALGPAAIRRTSGGTTSTPLTFSELLAADGESVSTSFLVYDSLGEGVSVDLTVVMESKTQDGVTWRWYAESPDDTGTGRSGGSGPDRFIGQGTVEFDNEGQFIRSPNATILIDRDGTGAIDPMQVTFNLSDLTSLASGPNAGAGSPTQSVLVMSTQDGFPAGTLRSYGVGLDGTIFGTFTNGLQRLLGQVAVATFTNPEGLVKESNNVYSIGPNSGLPVITTPMTMGAGQVRAGTLELSNVDLSRQFIGLVTASTGFSASGRVISTSDDLLRELLSLVR